MGTTETNGAANDARLTWPSRAGAAKRLGVSVSTIRRMQERGDLAPVQTPDGVWRFDPEELNACAEDAIAQEEEESAAPAVMTDVLAATTALLRQAHSHIERQSEPTARILQMMAAEREADRRRIDALEKTSSERLAAAENAVSLAHERALVEQDFIARNRRADLAVEELRKYGPHLLQRLTGGGPLLAAAAASPAAAAPSASVGAPSDEPPAELLTVFDVIANMSDEHLAALSAGGFISPKQAAAFAVVRRTLLEEASLRSANAKGANDAK